MHVKPPTGSVQTELSNPRRPLNHCTSWPSSPSSQTSLIVLHLISTKPSWSVHTSSKRYPNGSSAVPMGILVHAPVPGSWFHEPKAAPSCRQLVSTTGAP